MKFFTLAYRSHQSLLMLVRWTKKKRPVHDLQISTSSEYSCRLQVHMADIIIVAELSQFLIKVHAAETVTHCPRRAMPVRNTIDPSFPLYKDANSSLLRLARTHVFLSWRYGQSIETKYASVLLLLLQNHINSICSSSSPAEFVLGLAGLIDGRKSEPTLDGSQFITERSETRTPTLCTHHKNRWVSD